MFTQMFAQTSTTTSVDLGPGSVVALIIPLLFTIALLVAWWRIFTKADKPGWFCLIPILNIITLINIAGKPGWWFILLLIPFVNFVAIILIMMGLAESFGKSTLFALGLIFLNPIFMLILGFDDSRHVRA